MNEAVRMCADEQCAANVFNRSCCAVQKRWWQQETGNFGGTWPVRKGAWLALAKKLVEWCEWTKTQQAGESRRYGRTQIL